MSATHALIDASYRSDDFPSDWSRADRERSLARYKKWLRLKQRNPRSALAPTRDIDLFWHLHMLSPVAYFEDCMRNFGFILDHDGGFGKGKGELEALKRVFRRTEALWAEAYGESYRLSEDEIRKCWHDCQNRCWHACKE